MNDRFERFERVVALEGTHAREHFVHHKTEGEDVAAVIDPGAPNLLGAHVGVLALENASTCLRELRARFGDAEVDDLHAARKADEDVLRADIAVHDVERLAADIAGAVGVIKAERGLHDDPHADLKWQTDPGFRRGVPELREVLAGDVFHRDVVGAVELTDVVDGDDVGVVQRRGDAGFVEKLIDELRFFREVDAQRFEDREAIEHAGLASEKHLTHPALGDATNLFVLAKHQRHGRTLHRHRGGTDGFCTVAPTRRTASQRR